MASSQKGLQVGVYPYCCEIRFLKPIAELIKILSTKLAVRHTPISVYLLVDFMPNQKKLDSYKGKLSASEIAAGMNAAKANAMRLANDAQKLLETGSFPTAASLAALSIEESGKGFNPTSALNGQYRGRNQSKLEKLSLPYQQECSVVTA